MKRNAIAILGLLAAVLVGTSPKPLEARQIYSCGYCLADRMGAYCRPLTGYAGQSCITAWPQDDFSVCVLGNSCAVITMRLLPTGESASESTTSSTPSWKALKVGEQVMVSCAGAILSRSLDDEQLARYRRQLVELHL